MAAGDVVSEIVENWTTTTLDIALADYLSGCWTCTPFNNGQDVLITGVLG